MATPTYEEDLSAHMNAPISVSDAAAMYRRRIQPNCRPYDAAVIKLNNSLVDEWEFTVLQKLANKQGKIPASKVHFTWSVFAEGKELLKRQELKNYLPDVPEETAKYWIQFYREKSVEELHTLSIGLVHHTWNLITAAIRQYFLREKWDKIFSKSTDPLEWIKAANSHGPLMNQTKFPYGLTEETFKEMAEKFNSVMRHRVEPDRGV